MCDLHLDFTSAGGGGTQGSVVGGAVTAAAHGGARSVAVVAGDCAPRLGTWPTLKKLGKSCQEEIGSGTYNAVGTLCSDIFPDDITVKRGVSEFKV